MKILSVKCRQRGKYGRDLPRNEHCIGENQAWKKIMPFVVNPMIMCKLWFLKVSWIIVPCWTEIPLPSFLAGGKTKGQSHTTTSG